MLWGPSTQIHGPCFDTFVFSHRRSVLSRRWQAEVNDGDPMITGKLVPYVCLVYRKELTRSQIAAAHDDLVKLLSDLADEGTSLSDAVSAVAGVLIRMGRVESFHRYDPKKVY